MTAHASHSSKKTHQHRRVAGSPKHAGGQFTDEKHCRDRHDKQEKPKLPPVRRPRPKATRPAAPATAPAPTTVPAKVADPTVAPAPAAATAPTKAAAPALRPEDPAIAAARLAREQNLKALAVKVKSLDGVLKVVDARIRESSRADAITVADDLAKKVSAVLEQIKGWVGNSPEVTAQTGNFALRELEVFERLSQLDKGIVPQHTGSQTISEILSGLAEMVAPMRENPAHTSSTNAMLKLCDSATENWDEVGVRFNNLVDVLEKRKAAPPSGVTAELITEAQANLKATKSAAIVAIRDLGDRTIATTTRDNAIQTLQGIAHVFTEVEADPDTTPEEKSNHRDIITLINSIVEAIELRDGVDLKDAKLELKDVPPEIKKPPTPPTAPIVLKAGGAPHELSRPAAGLEADQFDKLQISHVSTTKRDFTFTDSRDPNRSLKLRLKGSTAEQMDKVCGEINTRFTANGLGADINSSQIAAYIRESGVAVTFVMPGQGVELKGGADSIIGSGTRILPKEPSSDDVKMTDLDLRGGGLNMKGRPGVTFNRPILTNLNLEGATVEVDIKEGVVNNCKAKASSWKGNAHNTMFSGLDATDADLSGLRHDVFTNIIEGKTSDSDIDTLIRERFKGFKFSFDPSAAPGDPMRGTIFSDPKILAAFKRVAKPVTAAATPTENSFSANEAVDAIKTGTFRSSVEAIENGVNAKLGAKEITITFEKDKGGEPAVQFTVDGKSKQTYAVEAMNALYEALRKFEVDAAATGAADEDLLATVREFVEEAPVGATTPTKKGKLETFVIE